MLQKALDILKTWCNKWRIGLNADKSKLIVFCKGIKPPINLYPLKINDIPIPYCKKVKFLGILFDTRLTFVDHVENIINNHSGY